VVPQRDRSLTLADGDLYFVQEPVGEMANLAYVIGSRATREAVLVDPAWDVESLVTRAQQDGMRVVGALATHYHQDHVGGQIFGLSIEGLPRLMELAPVPVHVHAHEAEGVRRVTGLSAGDFVVHQGGDVLELGGVRIRLLHTPGHTPGSQCFLVEEAGRPARLVSGDTLFLNGCGRVDLPGGDPEALYRSLHDVLKQLPDDTLVHPGHLYAEPVDSLGAQKRTNPYLRVATLEAFLGFLGY
jgi:glyoxylase-like metal-dependent hydrolase (beta-lactamase superfamily II)